MSIQKGGVEIRSIEDWRVRAGPKQGERQWVDGRSAKECAKAWLQGQRVPDEIAECLASHSDFGPLYEWTAEPEAKLPLDRFAGEPRNTDILITGRDAHGLVVIAVEAKADESFGEVVGDAFENALERRVKSASSNGIARIVQLAEALLGPPAHDGEPKISTLRYQLLTACAGALCKAREFGADRALMLVHEFVTATTDRRKQHMNATDLDAFVHRLSHGLIASVGAGQIVGPMVVPGYPLLPHPPKLYLGKVQRSVHAS